jgi:thioesterase domain-containing protein/acyl carrier protein
MALASSEEDQFQLDDGYQPPSNHVELVMAKIWGEVLDIGKVGVFDNFFDLGGSSLSAMRLITRLRSSLELDLPLRSIFLNPTIASLSSHISYHSDTRKYRYTVKLPKWNCLVPIQPTGTRTPLFFVGGAYNAPEDTLLILSRLVPHLGTDQPLFGFRPRFTEEADRGYTTVEQIAREFLIELRKVQPKGPYLLGGHCVGGIAALEIARLLLREGEEVKLLVLVDTAWPTRLRALFTDFFFMRLRAKHIAEVTSEIVRSNNRERGKIVRDLIRRKLGSQLSQKIPTTDRFYQLKSHYRRLLYNHLPEKYPGSVALIVNDEQARFDKDLGWTGAALGGLDVHTIPGDHDHAIPHQGKEVAQVILKCIDKAFAGSSSQVA